MGTPELAATIQDYTNDTAVGINECLARPRGYDQTIGNQCGLLTLGVFNRCNTAGIAVSRELHQDTDGNWHYLLRHGSPDEEPTEDDIISDLNPWQYNSHKGNGILLGNRNEVMAVLADKGAPAHFIALRSVNTLVISNDTRSNPFRPQPLAS